MQDVTTRTGIDARSALQFAWTWLLRVLLFVGPVFPFLLIFYFILPGSFGYVYVVLLTVWFLVELPLAAVRGPQSRTIPVVHVLQAAFCWMPVFYFLIFWSILFPGLRLFLSVWIVALFVLTVRPPGKNLNFRPERLVLIVGMLVLAGILVYLRVSLSLLLSYLVGLELLRRIVYRLKRERRLSMPAWMPMVFIAAYAMMMVAGLHAYCFDQRNEAAKIIEQKGVFRIDPDLYDPERLRDQVVLNRRPNILEVFFPSQDFIAFLPYGDNLLLVPQHELRILRLHKREGLFVLPTENVAADNLIVDAAAGCYFFVAGNTLYRGFVDNDVMEELHVFNEVNLKSTIPSFLRGWPEDNVQRLLVQYGNDAGFMVYDLTRRKAQRFDLGLVVYDSIFHPAGDKFIVVLNNRHMASMRLVLLAMDGTLLADEQVSGNGFVFLAPAVEDYFYLSLFVEGKLQKRSVDTLDLVGTFKVAPGTRGIKALPGGRCLLAPNYLNGRMQLLDAEAGTPLAGWWLGNRVRSITTSFDGKAYYLPSAAGLFGLDVALVDDLCAAMTQQTDQ